MDEGIKLVWLNKEERFGQNESKSAHINGRGVAIELLGEYVLFTPLDLQGQQNADPTLIPREGVRRIDVTQAFVDRHTVKARPQPAKLPPVKVAT